jgi:5'(3')-deoxyribonucleotidase
VDKIILTDVDGVLLDWEISFEQYVTNLGYVFDPNKKTVYDISEQLNITRDEGTQLISDFNHSSQFEFISSFRDSVEYVQRFKNEGWKFIAITTAGEHPDTWPLRRKNLDAVFGAGTIEQLYVLPLHGDKGVQLVNYRDSGFYWIEDKPSNAELGYKYGLRPLLMDNLHNKNYNGWVRRVNTWEEIHRIINDPTI